MVFRTQGSKKQNKEQNPQTKTPSSGNPLDMLCPNTAMISIIYCGYSSVIHLASIKGYPTLTEREG